MKRDCDPARWEPFDREIEVSLIRIYKLEWVEEKAWMGADRLWQGQVLIFLSNLRMAHRARVYAADSFDVWEELVPKLLDFPGREDIHPHAALCANILETLRPLKLVWKAEEDHE